MAVENTRTFESRAWPGVTDRIAEMTPPTTSITVRPFASAAMAAGVGLLAGLAAAWLGSRCVARRREAGTIDEWKAEVDG